MTVPEVLRSGDHGAIERCARRPSRRRANRPISASSRRAVAGGSTFHVQRRRLAVPTSPEGLPSPTSAPAEHHRRTTTVTRMLTSSPSPCALRKDDDGPPQDRWYPSSPSHEHRSRRAVLPAQRPPSSRRATPSRCTSASWKGTGSACRCSRAVIRRSGGGLRETFTVRKISSASGSSARSCSIRRRSPSSRSRSAGTSGERSSTTSGTCAGRRPGPGAPDRRGEAGRARGHRGRGVEELAEEGSMEALEEAVFRT